ncbi:putative O-methyltransferase [Rubidibacter lacunae KORDI 51-2]|uniref:Putative O-methyltransferase n=1 Tax=Rubidibacter lacunae KORDI 51-2 TaxID=582515 RepID=U5DLJ6_9CHRO|nr:class I SAM-dependent methyltransferase [Rubidibacter lacunae]ERN41752.1 putative O-methyltransferase [Rubidibacter lacunae KORDI 51-2]
MPGKVQEFASRFAEFADRLASQRFYNYPFGVSPRAEASTYREIWLAAKQNNCPAIDRLEASQGYSIDKDWMDELALLTQVVIKKSDICYQHGRILYAVLSSYVAASQYDSVNIVETGTARGYSSLCMAKALHDAGQPGKIFTFDILPHDVEMYWNCIADDKGSMSRAELLKAYEQLVNNYIVFIQGDTQMQLRKVFVPRVHLAYFDGTHTYEYVLSEFGHIVDKQKSGDIAVFDDYTPELFPGVVKAVDEICATQGYSKEVLTVSEQRGYAIARKK